MHIEVHARTSRSVPSAPARRWRWATALMWGAVMLALHGASCADGASKKSDVTSDVGDTHLGDGVSDTHGADVVPGALSLTSVTPSEGSVEGGLLVVLRGSSFEDGLRVRFGEVEATNVQIISATQASAVTPAASSAGPVEVTVTDGSGASARLAAGFTYLGPQQSAVGFCQLQAQSPAIGVAGEPMAGLYAVVFMDGVTQGGGQGGGLVGELGWGAVGAAPQDFTYQPMSYNIDVDGLNPGDMANDEYGATLTLVSPGAYRYAARFRTLQDLTGWVYCDLDGSDNGVADEQLGEIEIVLPAQAEVGFCKTETLTATVQTSTTSAAIGGLVYVADRTPGAGAGADLVVELVWGSGSDTTTWTGVSAASYLGDADGLSAGDLANDRYGAMVTPTAAGTYGYAFRVSLDAGASWTWCDTDGSGATDAFEASKVGSLTVLDVIVELVDWCNVQFPVIAEATVGAPLAVFGQVYEAGVTDVSDGDARIGAELLVGPAGADPVATVSAFTVIAAQLNTTVANQNNDEYMAAYDFAPAGDYSVFFRFSIDGGNSWRLCDVDGASDTAGFAASSPGVVRAFVAGGEPDLVDYCRVWNTSLQVAEADAAPVVTVEVFESSITQGGDGSNAAELVAEVGFGAPGANPAVDGAASAGFYTWIAASYTQIVNPNNYEYAGAAYASAPAPGDYAVAARVRRADTSTWTYCDTDPSNMEFAPGSVTSLSVTP